MSGIKQQIKLGYFRLFRNSYKRRLFSSSANDKEFDLLQKVLKEQELFFLDVGANKGEFVYRAEQVIPPEKIMAFEPLPWFAQKLKVLFPKVRVCTCALSDQQSKTTLYLPVHNHVPDDSLASVSKPVGGDFLTYEVELSTLDAITEKYKIRENSFLKIDVEGHEFAVLKGGENFIRDHVKVMLIEIEERHHKQQNLAEMLSKVENTGFEAFYLHPRQKQLVSFREYPQVYQENKDLNTPFYVNNFWFFAKQSDPKAVVATLNKDIL